MSDVATFYDAAEPLIVAVRGLDGRKRFQEDLEIMEMTTDDLAASINDLLAIMSVIKAPANKSAISQDESGQVQVAQELITTILAVAKASAYNLMARSAGKEPEYFGRLHFNSTLAVMAAVLRSNPDFFSMVLRNLPLGVAAVSQVETPGAASPQESES